MSSQEIFYHLATLTSYIMSNKTHNGLCSQFDQKQRCEISDLFLSHVILFYFDFPYSKYFYQINLYDRKYKLHILDRVSQIRVHESVKNTVDQAEAKLHIKNCVFLAHFILIL